MFRPVRMRPAGAAAGAAGGWASTVWNGPHFGARGHDHDGDHHHQGHEPSTSAVVRRRRDLRAAWRRSARVAGSPGSDPLRPGPGRRRGVRRAGSRGRGSWSGRSRPVRSGARVAGPDGVSSGPEGPSGGPSDSTPGPRRFRVPPPVSAWPRVPPPGRLPGQYTPGHQASSDPASTGVSPKRTKSVLPVRRSRVTRTTWRAPRTDRASTGPGSSPRRCTRWARPGAGPDPAARPGPRRPRSPGWEPGRWRRRRCWWGR